jgi:predicted nucleic acid-binding protein
VIVVDASVLIAYLDQADAHHERATSILTEFAGEVFVTSPITLAEVLVAPARADQAETIMNRLAQIPIGTVEYTSDAPLRLALLRAHTGLRMPDCCVLLATEQVAARVATFDHKLATAAADRGLRIIPTASAGQND